MLVDDSKVNLTNGEKILKDNFDVYTAQSAHRLFELLYDIVPDLILLNIEMPDMGGYEILRILKNDPRFADLPVIFLASASDENTESKGLSLGALDFISKPFSAPLLLKRVENSLAIVTQRKEINNYNINLQDMVKQKTKQVIDLQNSVLGIIAEMVEVRDNLTGGHVVRTQKYLELLLGQLIEDKVYQDVISTWDLEYIYASAQLHDVGKLAISDMILNKPSKLSVEEYNEMKRHPSFGVETLRKIEHSMVQDAFMRHALVFAGTHHEKWDGTGYPIGLRGEEIPLEGRLMAIADVYDALISHRSYKKPLSSAEAERVIALGSGTHFDPVLVDVFKKVAVQFAQVAAGHR